MNTLDAVNIKELQHIMSDYERVFDIVRLVDPEHTVEVSLTEEGIIKTEQKSCFQIWNKGDKCENCISKDACIQKKRMTKFEYRDNEMYSVIAMPFLVREDNFEFMISMEMVNRVSDDFIVKTKGETLASNAMELITYKIYKDSLTGVYNRRYLDEKRFIEKMRIHPSDKIGMVVVDINRLRHINEYYGHIRGDEMLFQVAKVLKGAVRASDNVIRFGGDEFVIIFANCKLSFIKKKIIELKKSVSNISLEWLGEFIPSIAVGMSYTENFNGSDEEIARLLNEADKRMYEDKSMPIQERKAMLIVDDLEVNREVLKSCFEIDFDIYEAEDGVKGLKVLEENAIEIIITDIYMPHMNGIEMIKEIRKNPEISKVIIFAITDRGEQWELAAIEAGADDFINKPFNVELLNHRIKGVLAQNTIFNRISQYQLSFNQNQIPFATVKYQDDMIQFEYVNDAFAQLMNSKPDDFVSGKRNINFAGFHDLIRTVCISRQRKQMNIYDDTTGKYYDIVAYAQENGFCSFIIVNNDAMSNLNDTKDDYEKYLRRMSKALVEAVNVYTEINLETMRYSQVNFRDEDFFGVAEEGDYEKAFDYICKNAIHPDDVEGVRNALSSDIIKEIGEDDNGIYELRVRYRLKNISPVKLMESRAFFVREGEQRYAIVIAEDITKENIVREQKTELSSVYEHIGVGVVISRLDESELSIVAVNPIGCKLLGIESEKIEKLNPLLLNEITHPDDIDRVQQERKKLASPGADISIECRVMNKKTKEYFWSFERSVSVLQDDGSILIYVCFYDISDQIKLRKLQSDMMAERKAAKEKSVFMANMSHEIRTPMNAIIGMTKLATDVAKDNEEIKKYLSQIEKSSEYLLGVLNDILDMSKITSGKLDIHREWISQRDLIVPVIQMMEPRMKEKDITFEYDHRILQAHKLEGYVDEQKVKQVLMNLLNNACKFTEVGGKVIFQGGAIAVDHDEHTCTLRFAIEDNGCGMSEEFLQKIYTPFEQERTDANMDVPGTGLGLAVTHSIVQALGGDISVSSKMGEGTKFIVSIPMDFRLRDKEADVKEHKEKTDDNKMLRGKRILLAEDHPLNAIIAVKILEKVGMIVTHVSDGEEAVKTFNNSLPNFYDAILMDVRMPKMDGLTATKAIRNLEKTDAKIIPIIAMTANAYDEDRRKSIDAGMNVHLAKPVQPEVLYDTLRKFIGDNQ